MFGYSFTILFCLLKHYKIINFDWEKDFYDSISLLEKEKNNIKKEASRLANKIQGKTPVIYVASGFLKSAAIRFRQQLK